MSRMSIDPTLFFSGLICGPDGVWRAGSVSSVSYPAEGNAQCLAVEDSSFWFRHRNRCILATANRFGAPGVIADVGGGNGYVAAGFQQAGYQPIVIEPGSAGALAARARGIETVICATIGDLASASALPAAGMFDVLEHIEDDTSALHSARAMLEPRGLLFLTVPAFETLRSADDRIAGHYRRYTTRSLSRALDVSGFAVTYMSYFFLPLLLPVLLLRTIPSWIGCRNVSSGSDAADHSDASMLGRMVNVALEREYRRVAAGKTLPAGTSILAVARAR